MLNRFTIGTRLYGAFATICLMVVIAAALAFAATRKAELDLHGGQSSANGAAALANAQSALWELRYGFPQFMVGDEVGRKKITDAEPGLSERVEQAFQVYESAGSPGDSERRALSELKVVFARYMEARPKWFELQGAGKAEEAARWRAATTTPLGAGTVKAFSELIEVQRKAAEQREAAAIVEINTMQTRVAVLVLLSLIASVTAAWVVTRSISVPLRLASDMAQRVANGDLRMAPQPAGRDEVAQLLGAMGTMVANLRHMVGEVRTSTDSINTASSEIATGNLDLSVRTEQTASNLQQASSSMEQLTGTVKQSADSARQANQLASSAAEVAARGGGVVSKVVTTMNEINASSKQISDIVGVIDGIAFQTNILALNAAVEAARAGEQGRGFAVVASEVRSLAQRSAQAAKEIKVLIGTSVEKVESGSRLVAAAGQTMHEIVDSVRRVSDIVGEITTAATEQSNGIGQMHQSVSQLDRMTQQNAALVEQSAAAAESLQGQTVKLASLVAVFKLGSGQLAHA